MEWNTSECSALQVDDATVVFPSDGAAWGQAIGSPVMKDNEEHSYVVTIHESKYHDGAGLWIGVKDTETDNAWGLHPSNGTIYKFEGQKEQRVDELKGVSIGKHAKGATIKLEVNMKLKKVYYSINGSPPLNINVRLPKSVRPWVFFRWGLAKVSLSDYLGPLERGELKERAALAKQAAEEATARAQELERRVAEAMKWKAEMEAMIAHEPDSDLVRRLKGRIEELETALEKSEEALVAKKQEVKEALEAVAAKPREPEEDPRVAELEREIERLKRENADLKAGGAFADGRVESLNQENSSLKEELDLTKAEAKMFHEKAWAAAEENKQLKAKLTEVEKKDTEVVEGVQAGQSASQNITESPASPAIAPLMMFGAKATQGAGDYKVTAVGTVEVKMLMDVWQSGIEHRYVIRRIEGIQASEELKNRFETRTRIIDTEIAKAKAQKTLTFPDSDGDKEKIMAKITKKYTRTDGLGHAKLMIAFHGCDPKMADHICSEGFVKTLKDTRYGKGCKMSTCAAQVCRAVVNTPGMTKTSEGEYVLLVGWTVPGPVYPISQAEDYKEGETHSKWESKRLKAPFTTHYACIGADGEALSGHALEGPTDDVLVIQAHEQILPAYRIYFTEKV